MGSNLKLSSSGSGTRNLGPFNMGGGANLIQRSLFSTNTPTLSYSQWYTPGNGSPAISTSDYYLLAGMAWSRPYDLDAMGADGATIKAANGGNRYVWLLWSDHSGNWPGSVDMLAGFSNDPQVWPEPTTTRVIHTLNDFINVVDQNGATQNNIYAYQTAHLVYNPDPAMQVVRARLMLRLIIGPSPVGTLSWSIAATAGLGRFKLRMLANLVEELTSPPIFHSQYRQRLMANPLRGKLPVIPALT